MTEYMDEMDKQTKEKAIKLSLASLNIQQTIKSICNGVVDRALKMLYKCLYVEEDRKKFEIEMDVENIENNETQSPTVIDSQLNAFAEKLKDFYSTLNSKFTDCFFKTMKSTADAIRKRIRLADAKETKIPLILSTLTLENNIIVLVPSVDQLQESLSVGNEMILNIFNSIPLWDQETVMPWMTKRLRSKKQPGMTYKEKKCDGFKPPVAESPEFANSQTNVYYVGRDVFYGIINDNKEIQSLLSILNNSLSTLNTDISEKLSRFKSFSFLWESSIESFLEDFMKTDPQMSEFIAELSRFERINVNIN